MSFWDYVPHTKKGLAVAPLTPLFAIGAGLNKLTGGKSPTWSPVKAVQTHAGNRTTYSTTTQALSGYQGSKPKEGVWTLPVVNPAGARVVRDVAKGALKGLGLDPKLLVIAGAAALAIATR